MPAGVIIHGGYAGSAFPAAPGSRNFIDYATILSGDIGAAGIATDNSYSVVNITTGTLDGLTITAGNGTNSPSTCGGGATFFGAVTVANCTFTSNTSTNGGAIDVIPPFSAETISSCRFVSNSASAFGGAVNCQSGDLELADCVFVENKALVGGAVAATTLDGTRCTFTRNRALG
ncbi:MAG TPA: hypothetical protein VH370_20335, partial [Humisphaera sp.]|nr:hypothetical protein [Humisphaera sp.]